MLTVEKLEGYSDRYIIDSGIIQDDRLHTAPVVWVAVMGQINDWAIYYHKAELGLFYAVSNGNKCTTEAIIRELVPCTDEAFAQYRN